MTDSVDVSSEGLQAARAVCEGAIKAIAPRMTHTCVVQHPCFACDVMDSLAMLPALIEAYEALRAENAMLTARYRAESDRADMRQAEVERLQIKLDQAGEQIDHWCYRAAKAERRHDLCNDPKCPNCG